MALIMNIKKQKPPSNLFPDSEMWKQKTLKQNYKFITEKIINQSTGLFQPIHNVEKQNSNGIKKGGNKTFTYEREAEQLGPDMTQGSTSSWDTKCYSKRIECTHTFRQAWPDPSCSGESPSQASAVDSSASTTALCSCTGYRNSSCPPPDL